MIPILANNATAVLETALKYKTAGFSLVFKIVGGEEYQLAADGYLEQIIWRGNLPLTGERINPDRIIPEISKGFVTISFQSPGRNPHYYKELHRARGVRIPVEE